MSIRLDPSRRAEHSRSNPDFARIPTIGGDPPRETTYLLGCPTPAFARQVVAWFNVTDWGQVEREWVAETRGSRYPGVSDG